MRKRFRQIGVLLFGLFLGLVLHSCGGGLTLPDSEEAEEEEESGGGVIATFTIGGSVVGLSGTVVLQNNLDLLIITENGSFTFLDSLEDGASYEVTAALQPSGETCIVTGGTGTLGGANVTDVVVSCLSADAEVSSLALSIGSLSPSFDSETTSYTASVNFLTSSMTLTPTASDSGASMTVNGTSVSSGSGSESISLDEGSNTITFVATAADGITTQTYTVTVTRESTSSFAQQAYAKASNTGGSDNFGYNVAISGNTTMVVGAIGEDSNATGIDGDESNNTAGGSGAAYVFVRDGTTWSQQAYLKASNTDASDSFGFTVDISDNTIVVGANGEDSNATGVDGDDTDDSALTSGAAYVFVRNGTTWSQQAYLKASNTDGNDNFGYSVSISGDTIVVGAIGESSNATGVDGDQSDDSLSFAGAAYVFVRDGTTWNQQAYVKASNPDSSDQFGFSVDISDDTIVVGALEEDSNATGVDGDDTDDSASISGAAYVFFRSGTTWSQQAYLKASNTDAGDRFGQGVAISGDTVVVGAFGEDSNATGIDGDETDDSLTFAGAAYVFVRSGTTWSQQAYLKASNTEASDGFAREVAISGDIIVVGARGEDSNVTGVNGDEDDNSTASSGAAYVFVRSGTTWSQKLYLKASNTAATDFFGFDVSISGDSIVVSAYQEDSNATGIDGDESNNSASASGAAYTFQ